MILKSNCPHCDGPVEYEHEGIGQTIDCPHCNEPFELKSKKPTLLEMPPAFVPPRKSKKLWLIIAVWVCGVGVIALLVWAFMEYGAALIAASGSILLAVMAFVALTFLLILAVLWFLFPMFVYNGMNRMEAILKQIEHNTRK